MDLMWRGANHAASDFGAQLNQLEDNFQGALTLQPVPPQPTFMRKTGEQLVLSQFVRNDMTCVSHVCRVPENCAQTVCGDCIM